MTFNPGLNRVTLTDLQELPAGMAGTEAHTWLASWGLAARMSSRLPVVGQPSIPTAPLAIPERLRACAPYPVALSALVEQEHPEALAFADELGVALAALIATLTLAPAEARFARPEWPDSHWARWKQVRRIGLGGGQLSGSLGRRMVEHARNWLPRLGAGEVQLSLATRPQLLPLSGLARVLPSGEAILLDAGHTSIKRASVVVDTGGIGSLTPWPSLSAPLHLTSGDGLTRYLVEAAAELAQERPEVTQFGLSLSAHLGPQGLPLPGSLYSTLAELDEPLEQALQALLSARLNRPVHLRLLHEGKAAALAFGNQADAVILLGTSVGGGLN